MAVDWVVGAIADMANVEASGSRLAIGRAVGASAAGSGVGAVAALPESPAELSEPETVAAIVGAAATTAAPSAVGSIPEFVASNGAIVPTLERLGAASGDRMAEELVASAGVAGSDEIEIRVGCVGRGDPPNPANTTAMLT